MKLKQGDTFKINTKIGYGFLQYLETDDMGIEFVRVLEPISKDGNIDQSLIDNAERWIIGFPLKVATKRKIVEKVGNFNIPNSFVNYDFARSEHNIRGEFLGWHIVHKETLQRVLKKALTSDELKLSPHGVMNDTLIIERLEQNWKLLDWNKEL